MVAARSSISLVFMEFDMLLTISCVMSPTSMSTLASAAMRRIRSAIFSKLTDSVELSRLITYILPIRSDMTALFWQHLVLPEITLYQDRLGRLGRLGRLDAGPVLVFAMRSLISSASILDRSFAFSRRSRSFSVYN